MKYWKLNRTSQMLIILFFVLLGVHLLMGYRRFQEGADPPDVGAKDNASDAHKSMYKKNKIVATVGETILKECPFGACAKPAMYPRERVTATQYMDKAGLEEEDFSSHMVEPIKGRYLSSVGRGFISGTEKDGDMYAVNVKKRARESKVASKVASWAPYNSHKIFSKNIKNKCRKQFRGRRKRKVKNACKKCSKSCDSIYKRCAKKESKTQRKKARALPKEERKRGKEKRKMINSAVETACSVPALTCDAGCNDTFGLGLTTLNQS